MDYDHGYMEVRKPDGSFERVARAVLREKEKQDRLQNRSNVYPFCDHDLGEVEA